MPSRPGALTPPGSRRLAPHGWLAGGVLCWCLVTAGGGMTTTDAVVAYDVTRGVVERRSLATSGNLIGNDAYQGRDGRYYSPFGIAQSVWNIPFYLVGREAARATHQTARDTVEKAVVALATVPAVALLAGVCSALLTALGVGLRPAIFTVLVLIFATPLWPYSKFGFNQPLCALFLWAAVLAVEGSRRTAGVVAAGLLTGLALLTRHEMLLVVPMLAAYLVWRRSDRLHSLAAYLAGVMPGVMLWALLNWWRFGDLFETGYSRDPTPGFGGGLSAGIQGLMFSGYASLLLYCPVVLLAVPASSAMQRRRPGATGLFVILFASFFLLYASLGNWMGGRSYGPRYLVPLLPAVVLPLAFWQPRGAVRRLRALTIAVSVAVQIPGVVVDYSKVRMAEARAGTTVAEDLRPFRAPLLLNAYAAVASLQRTTRHLLQLEPRPVVPSTAPDLGAALSFSPDFWWLYLFYLGRSGPTTTLMIPLALVVVGLLAVRKALRMAPRDGQD